MINSKLKHLIGEKKNIYEMACLRKHSKLFNSLDVTFRLCTIKTLFSSFSCRDVNLLFTYVIRVYHNSGQYTPYYKPDRLSIICCTFYKQLMVCHIAYLILFETSPYLRQCKTPSLYRHYYLVHCLQFLRLISYMYVLTECKG